jgi:hypothetical protein
MTVIQDAVQASGVGLRPVAGHIGADITDIDISRPLAPEQVAGIRDALHRWVTLVGDVPVGPDGRASELVAGKPFTSKHNVVVAD